MGALEDFFHRYNDAGDSLLGVIVMEVAGQSIPVVWDSVTRSKSGALGGLDNDTLAAAVAQPKNIDGDPAAFLGKRCTIEGKIYRINDVDTGKVNVTFTLISPNSTG
jgi:hypothetical protein